MRPLNKSSKKLSFPASNYMSRLTGSPPHRLTIIILMMISLFVVALQPSKTFGQTANTTIADIPRTIFQIIDKIQAKIASILKISGAVGFKSSLDILERSLLNSVTTSLATTGPGQRPLFLTNPKTFFKNVTNAAAGDFIDNFTRGVTGQTGPGLPLSGSRGKFLISQLLRAQAGQVISGVTTQCKQNCDNNFSADNLDTSGLKTMSASEFSQWTKSQFRNDHEWNIWVVTYDLEGPNGTQAQIVKGLTDGACNDIQEAHNGPTTTWAIGLGATWSSGTMPLTDCQAHQTEALNVEKGNAQAEVNQCVQSCQAGGTAASNAANNFTATDVFSAVQNANPRQAPAALANALSSDKSDIGQFLTAAGALTATVQEKVVGEQTNLNPNVLPATTKVSDTVITPSTATSELFGLSFNQNQGQSTYTGVSVADVLKGIASFINSPVGTALTTYFKSKCGLNPEVCKGPSNARSTIGQLVFGSGNATGVAGAQLLYATSGQAQIISGDPGRNEISITDQLTTNGLIDSGFRQAIEGTITVQDAIKQHLLDPQKTFGFDKNGVEPRDGYPYRALQYLRKYRVTPVGWELAARYSQLFDHRDLSLGYLTQRYDICGQDAAHRVCSRGPKTDQSCQVASDCTDPSNTTDVISCGASPYCGLVDPNWVLKAPQTYCRRQGAGEEVIAKQFVCDQNNIDAATGNAIKPGDVCSAGNTQGCTDIGAPNCVTSTSNPAPDIGRWVIERNTDTCADTQSCITENEDGSCLAFGYCVQERQQFKFDGTQCAAENSSCTAYTNLAGQAASYLANTLDFQNCNADNAGCTQYCAANNYDPTKLACTGNDTINFTAKVQRCDQSQAGCHQFLQTTNNTNLLANGGFETADQPLDSLNSAALAGWTKSGGLAAYSVSADDPGVTANNKAAVKLAGASGDALTQVVHTGYDLYERSFTLSVRAKAGTACAATLTLEPDAPLVANRPRIPADGQPNMAVTTDWNTYSVTLSIPSADVLVLPSFDLKAGVQLSNCATQNIVIDSAQLEAALAPSTFHDYGATNAIYLNADRQQCTSADVGCQAYTPVAGGSNIFGQVRNSNRCSADQVGCATYQLEPITNVPPRTGGAVQIVAPKGQICSAADVGCEEYTNLDVVAQGGEGKEYFKSVKQCVKPSQTNATNPISATYYTWIGDAKLGYVLRAYDLVQSTVVDASGGHGPCTSLTVGSAATAPTCNDTAATVAAASCAVSNLASNPDCGQYYDSALNVYYRLRSRTVTVTEDCHPYRNTIDQSDAARKDLVYYLATKENLTCSSAAASCRAYTGNASGTTRQVLGDNFETNGTVNWIGGTASNAAVNLNGHSMLITAGGASSAAVTTDKTLANQIFSGRTYLLTFSAAAESATASTMTAQFGRLSGSTFQPFNAGAANETTFSGTAKPTWNENITPKGPEWHSFTLGPLAVDQDFANSQLALRVAGGSAYVDNVVLTEVNDHIYLVSTAVPQCSIKDVGCAAYRDAKGGTNYLTSFNRLCSEQVVGCEALIDTQNSTTPFEQTVKNVTTPADTIVTLVNNPANYCAAAGKGCAAVGRPVYGPDQKLISYQTQYLINDPDRYRADLCTDGSNSTPNELSCQVYTAANGTAAYFKDPGQRVCDYRPGLSGNGGWYITGTAQPCPTVTPPLAGRPVGPSCSPVCVGGSRAGQACTNPVGTCSNDSSRTCAQDANCRIPPLAVNGAATCQWSGCDTGRCTGDASRIGQIYSPVDGRYKIGSCSSNTDCRAPSGGNNNVCVYLAGSCLAEQNGCTEYRDPTDPAGCRSECPLSLAQGGSPDYVDAACQRTQCADGDRQGQNCQNDLDCQDSAGVHSCVGGDGQPAQGLPGCRPYYYLRQSIAANAGDCNGVVNPAIGCRPFNDTTNPDLNFRGQ